MSYVAPWWLPGGHLQTIWPALHGQHGSLRMIYRRARWASPDQDFIDVDWMCEDAPPNGAEALRKPLLVLFHGLEGNSQSHYARAFAACARQQGWAYAVPHFRGCSGEINVAPRAYHSGDYAEIDWILRRFRSEHQGPIAVVGVSLGGNALLRWAQEAGSTACQLVQAVLPICAPIDLTACGRALERGLNRVIYTPMFLKSMKPKALLKWAQHPGLFSKEALMAARTLYEFDNVFTAPLHGFKDAADYWLRASAKPQLQALQTPTLLIHAMNDPFVPASSVPVPHEVSDYVSLWQPVQGGHVGFCAGSPPGHLRSLPAVAAMWLRQHLTE